MKTISFDEWWNENNLPFDGDDDYKNQSRSAWKHQQAKIDELQARVDGVLKACNNLRTDLIRENHVEYDKGWKDCATSIYYQLKGKEDE